MLIPRFLAQDSKPFHGRHGHAFRDRALQITAVGYLLVPQSKYADADGTCKAKHHMRQSRRFDQPYQSSRYILIMFPYLLLFCRRMGKMSIGQRCLTPMHPSTIDKGGQHFLVVRGACRFMPWFS